MAPPGGNPSGNLARFLLRKWASVLASVIPVPALRILIVDENPERADLLEEALRESGYEPIGRLSPAALSAARVQEMKPDMVIVDVDSPSRDTLESMREITREQPKPIVMFVDQSDEGSIAEAMQAGVSAYVIDGLNPRRVKPILDVAVARFREFQALRAELDRAKTSLAERKLIERAKGILMRERGLDEPGAYAALRKLAMDRQQRLSDVAETLIAFADLLRK